MTVDSVVKLCVAASIVALSVWITLVLSPPVEELAPSTDETPVEAVLIETEPAPADAGLDAGPFRPAPHPLTAALCPKGMNWVSGPYCPQNALAGDGCRV